MLAYPVISVEAGRFRRDRCSDNGQHRRRVPDRIVETILRRALTEGDERCLTSTRDRQREDGQRPPAFAYSQSRSLPGGAR